MYITIYTKHFNVMNDEIEHISNFFGLQVLQSVILHTQFVYKRNLKH